MGQMHLMCMDGAYVDVREYLAVAASIAPAPKPCHHGTVAPHVRGCHNSSGRGSFSRIPNLIDSRRLTAHRQESLGVYREGGIDTIIIYYGACKD